ncbi:MAG: glucoamylase family protein [Planctomycetota bacterium]
MTPTTRLLCLASIALPAATAQAQNAESAWRAQTGYDGAYVVIQEDDAPRPPFAFSGDDDAFLEEVSRATFRWIWDSPDVTAAGLIKDRSSGQLVSIAGVGYQLGAITIGVERGYITRRQGETRATQILEALLRNDTNRKAGLFYHFLDEATNGPRPTGDGVSTIDSSILFAGVLTAAAYFGGEVEHLGNTMFEAADWTFFQQPASRPEWVRGMISLLWRPDDRATDPTGPGSLINPTWLDAMGEQRLIYFLAAAAPNPARRIDPNLYYRLRRTPAQWDDLGPMIQLPGAGGTFLAFFDQLWIDDASIGEANGPDRPDLRGFDFRTPTDWWENSRRHAKMHRGKAIAEAPEGFTTLGENSWGLSASDGPTGYQVPGLFGDVLPLPGAQTNFDLPGGFSTDRWLDGTVAVYGAGSMIMFEPDLAVAALRYYRSLETAGGSPLIWEDEFGFEDAFNLHIDGAPWIAADRLAIDQGPLLIAIENARSGLIWETFHKHPFVIAAMERLGLSRD